MPVSPEEVTKIRSECSTNEEAAARLGISERSVRRAINAAKATDTITQPFEIPEGFRVKKLSVYTGPEGEVKSQWTKLEEGRDPESTVEFLKTAFADYQYPAPISPIPDCVFQDACALFPLPDLHWGCLALKDETGKNWDVKIAEREVGSAIERLVSLTPPTKQAILLGGGDAQHADNRLNKTENSGNALDVDGRFDRVLLTNCFFHVRYIDLILQKHEKVEVRVLKGNHDPHVAVAISYFLLAHYRNDSRVHVDVSANLFWHYRFGRTMLAATHGHEAKPDKLPMIMAVDWPQDWAASTHRYGHTFHVHHASKIMTEVGGVVVETHRAPVARDAWHAGQGYRSGRSLSAILYDKENGEVARSTVNLT